MADEENCSGGDAQFYISKLQKLVAGEKEKGLIGFSLLAVANRDGSPADIARVASNIYEAHLAGDSTEITDQAL